MNSILEGLSGGSSMGFFHIIVSILLAFVLSVIIVIVYKKTHHSVSYSRSFLNSLIIICSVVSVIMVLIGSNVAAAFGALGALSLIRFRTAVKDPRDIAFMLFVVSIGMACGIGHYEIAVLGTLLICSIIFILNKYNFGSVSHHDFVLTFSLDSNQGTSDVYKPVFSKYITNDQLLNVHTKQSGQIIHFTFSVRFREEQKIHDFIKDMNSTNGISQVDVLSTRDDIEY